MFDLRLIHADALKLGRRYGMLAISLFLTVGITLIAFSVTAAEHAGNASSYGPAGGLRNYQDAISFLGLMTFVVAAIVGSTAGSQDIETGVFRDLAATGRSRVALFGSRITGALVILLPIVALTAALTAGLSVALAGSLAGPSVGAIVGGTFGLVAAAALGTFVAVGLAALIGSRGPVIAMLLAFELAIAPLLTKISLLGVVRQALPSNALDRITESHHLAIPMDLATAIVVVLAWAGAAFAAGAWRTRTQEI
jgi:ABC-type transport system involved in multi-copper enzyme maturation permease subunit